MRLAEMLARGEIHDDVLAAHVVTIPEVRLSPDLRLATVYVTPLGGEDLAPVLAALDSNREIHPRRGCHTSSISNLRPTCASVPTRRSTRRAASTRSPLRQGGAGPQEGLTPGNPQIKRRSRMARRKKGRPVHGWLVLDKPVGMTSTQAVGAVRRRVRRAEGGHAGTLDPLATGILPIALGEATKTVPYAVDGQKSYRFTVRWGVKTDTDDAEGRTVKTSDMRPDRARRSRRCCRDFTGEIQQVPPAFSAIKIDGNRAYDLARERRGGRARSTPAQIDRLDLGRHAGCRHGGVRGRLRQGHLCARACQGHGSRARLPRPCHRAAPHAGRRLRRGGCGHAWRCCRRRPTAGPDELERLLLPIEAALRRAGRSGGRPERCGATAARPGRADPRPRCAVGWRRHLCHLQGAPDRGRPHREGRASGRPACSISARGS